jgi:protein-S-isoprenylcysteine O-methyltransferase Ste14
VIVGYSTAVARTASSSGGGVVWVAVQALLFLAMAVSLVTEPVGWLRWFELPGAVLLVLGVMTGVAAVMAYQTTNRTPLSPLPEPNREHRLVTRGVYGWVRHPIYSAILLGSFGLALFVARPLTLAIAMALAVFFWLKSRHEDRLLLEVYPEYRAYASHVGRFVPGLGRLRN